MVEKQSNNSSLAIASWLKKNYCNINININNLEWITKYFPNYFDVESIITINGHKSHGRGNSDISKEHAVEKSITEAIERAIFKELKTELDESITTTSGLALHVNERKAILSASLEIIERDLFFCHYLTKTPFLDISNSPLVNKTLFEIAVSKIKTDGINLKLGQLLLSPQCSAFVCVAFGDNSNHGTPFGVVVGAGCDVDQTEAINKAVLECLPNVVAHISGTHNKMYQLNDFLGLQNVNPLDHLAIGKNLDNVNYIRSLFTHSASHTHELSSSELFFKDMIIKSVEFPSWCKDSGLVAMRAYNPQLQKIYFGRTTKEKINFNRLSQFCGRDITFEDIHHYPHPFP